MPNVQQTSSLNVGSTDIILIQDSSNL